MIPFGKLHPFGQQRLRLLYRALEIAVAHTELDRDVPLVVLAVDDVGPRLRRQRGQLLERNTGAVRRADQDVADGFHVLPILRQKPDDEVEQPLAFVHFGDRLAADRRLHDGVHVRHLEPVSGARFPINLDQEIRLPHEPEDPKILHAANLPHLLLDHNRRRFHGLQIGTEQLDRVLSLHTGHRFLHVVLDDLREIENDAGNSPQALFDFLDQPVFG